MKRTLVNNEVRNVARFLAKLMRRNDKTQRELILELEKLAAGRNNLKAFDRWLRDPDDLVAAVAKAVRTWGTQSYVLQACSLASGKRGRQSMTDKLAEVITQRNQLVKLIW